MMSLKWKTPLVEKRMVMALVRLADFAQIGFIVVGSSLFPVP